MISPHPCTTSYILQSQVNVSYTVYLAEKANINYVEWLWRPVLSLSCTPVITCSPVTEQGDWLVGFLNEKGEHIYGGELWSPVQT